LRLISRILKLRFLAWAGCGCMGVDAKSLLMSSASVAKRL